MNWFRASHWGLCQRGEGRHVGGHHQGGGGGGHRLQEGSGGYRLHCQGGGAGFRVGEGWSCHTGELPRR